MAKKILKAAAALVGTLAAVVVIYVIYVVVSYHRIEDRQEITADAPYGGTEAATQIDLKENSVFRIVTMNMGFGAYTPAFDFFMDGGTSSWAESKESAQESIIGAVENLREYDPDFLLLQEVDVDATRSYHLDEYELVRSKLPEYTSAFAVNYDSAFLFWPLYQPHGSSKAGIALCSKYEITDTLRRSLPISGGFGKFLDLDRCYTINRISVSNGKELVIFNVHLSAYGADETIMAGQRQMLFSDMETEYQNGNYVIVGGDFNHDMIGNSQEYFQNAVAEAESWAKPFDFASVPEGFTVGAKAAVEGGRTDMAATCRDSGRPYDGTNDRWILDSFLYSDNIEVLEYDTIDQDFQYSDHNPVGMKFQIVEELQENEE